MSAEEKRDISKQFYDAMAEVAKQVDALGVDSKAVKNRVDEIRNLFTPNVPFAQNHRQHGLRVFGIQTLNDGKPLPIALNGTVESMGKIDEQPIVRLAFADGNSVLLLCPTRHDGSYKKGDTLFVLGRRLSQDEHSYDDSQVVRADVIAVSN